MDSGHVPRHVSGSSFKSDGVLAFITLSSLPIFFCWPAEGILLFNLDSVTDVINVLHLGTNIHIGAWPVYFTAMLMDVGFSGVPPLRLAESPIVIQQYFSENLFVDSGLVSSHILKTSHTIIALVTHNSSPVFIFFGFSDEIFHFKDVNLKQYEIF